MNEQTLKVILACYFVLSALWGCREFHQGKFHDMWNYSNAFGKILTVLYGIVLLPGLVLNGAVYIIETVFLGTCGAVRKAAFPRSTGYELQIEYDEELFKALKENKIYCEHRNQCSKTSSYIVFLCRKDYEKALSLFPGIENKITEFSRTYMQI